MAATLDVRAVSSMDAARADVESLGDAVRGLGSDVDAAGGQARAASANLDGLGEGADNVSSKSSQAAGAMGDLAGGLDAVGATGAADALNTVAIASQVAAGAGDVLNLVAETSAGRWIVASAATVAHTAVTVAHTVATVVATAATTAFGVAVAVATSPVTLIIAAILLAVGAVILLYKHSETFRGIVDGAFSRAKEVVSAAADAVEDILGWFGRLPDTAREAWEAVRQAVADKIGDAIDTVQDLIDKITTGVSGIVGTVSGYFSSMFAPISTAIGWVQDLIDKLSGIHFDLPGNPFTRNESSVGPTGKPTTGPDPTTPTGPPIVGVTLSVAPQDKDAATRDLVEALREYFQRHGQTLSLTGTT